jgi:hypothetical protein
LNLFDEAATTMTTANRKSNQHRSSTGKEERQRKESTATRHRSDD